MLRDKVHLLQPFDKWERGSHRKVISRNRGRKGRKKSTDSHIHIFAYPYIEISACLQDATHGKYWIRTSGLYHVKVAL